MRRLGSRLSLSTANSNGKKKEIQQLLQNEPTFPGVPLHVCTENVSLDEINSVKVNFPVHIRDTTLVKEGKRASSTIPADRQNSLQNGVPLQQYKLHVKSWLYADQGSREYMEDTFTTIDELQPELNGEISSTVNNCSFYGIYDGHAGGKASKYCENNLHNIIIDTPAFKEQKYEEALNDGIQKADEIIIEQGTNEEWSDGSCVSVSLIVNKSIYCGNLGDSHMIIGTKKCTGNEVIEFVSMSDTHRASNPAEKKRIVELGGMILRNRVFGDLSISRAVGDRNYKKPKQDHNFITSEPFLAVLPLTVEHQFLIMASDGLWDVFEFQAAVEYVYRHFQECNDPEVNVSDLLVKEARERGSGDNITVIVVQFRWTADQPKPDDLTKEEPTNDENNNKEESRKWVKSEGKNTQPTKKGSSLVTDMFVLHDCEEQEIAYLGDTPDPPEADGNEATPENEVQQ